MEQLRSVAKGEYKTPSTEKRKFGTIVFAAISLPVIEIQGLLDNVSKGFTRQFSNSVILKMLVFAHVYCTWFWRLTKIIKSINKYTLRIG